MALNVVQLGGRTACIGQQTRTLPFARPVVQVNCPVGSRGRRQVLLVRSLVQGDGVDGNKEQTRLEQPASVPSTDPADWEEEMSIFKQRTMRPNQLATLRELQSRVDLGKVLHCQDGLAIVEGLNSDAPVGTQLSFVSGASGVLLWRRSDKLCFALVFGEQKQVEAGEGVECKIAGILQVVDEKAGPLTKRDYMMFKVPAGNSLKGKVVDHLARTAGTTQIAAREAMVPLLNKVVQMEHREPIKECLLTGVKALDALTPMGRGQQMLVIGPNGSGKTTLSLDTILAQQGTGVRCVYAAVGCSQQALEASTAVLEASGAMAYTTVVAATDAKTLSEQFAAIATACCIGERVREEGGASLVVVDSLSPMVRVWESLTVALASLGEQRLADGLFKDSTGRDIPMPPPQSDHEMVMYEGTMVTAAASMRRGFFTSLLQRAAKVDVLRGSGSMTLVGCVPGRPATGQSVHIDMSKYKTLSEEQKQRMLKVLQAKAGAAAQAREVAPGEMRTELVEEMMSISDGQVVLEERPSPTSPYMVSPQLSVSRIGSRAYYKALGALAPFIRLELAQAADARKNGANAQNPVIAQQERYAELLRMALTQPPRSPVSLAQQVVILYAIKSGFLGGLDASAVSTGLSAMLAHVEAAVPEALEEISSTKQFTARAERLILQALQQYAAPR